MTVQEIMEQILRNEGGFVNDPNDNGGATNMGITIRTLSDWLGYPATVQDVKNLDKATAIDIYEKKYYLEPGFNKLPIEVQPIMTDTGVLYGTRRAVKFLQSIVNQAGFGPIDEDGTLGPQTRAKVELANQKMGGFLINAIAEERIMFCQTLVANNPSQEKFLRGWTNRANAFKVEIP